MANQPVTSSTNDRSIPFAHKVWVTVGIVTAVFIALFLLWFALKELLAIFAGILLAVFLHGISRWLAAHSFLPRKIALFATIAALIILTLLIGFLLIPNLVQQSDQLGEQLRLSLNGLETRFTDSEAGQIMRERMSGLQSLTGDTSSLISRASTIFSSTLDAAVRVVIILFVGFYLAYEPDTYLNGLLTLLPRSRRPRYREA